MEPQKISVVNISVPTDCEELFKECFLDAKLNFKDSLKRQKCAIVWEQIDADLAAAPKKEENKPNIEDVL